MDHSELVSEMPHVERLSTQERLHLARRRRLQQLKIWSQREKEWNSKKRNSQVSTFNRKGRKNHHIFFDDSVMLLEAASRNDIQEVRWLLMKGVSPDSTNEDGLTALHQCCIDDNEEMMKLLLDFRANVNAEDSERWTPLHAAATCGHLHLVKYLIMHGANLLAVNADGNMPYDICEDDACLDYIEGEMAKRGVTQELIDDTRAANEHQMLQDLQELAAKGGDLEYYDEQGATPLHISSANGYLKVVEFLLDLHVSTDVKDNDSWQPVHAAACWGHLEVLELLVQNGADLNARTKHDETPSDICEDPELRERIVQLRSEQETKRMQEAQRRRVRRSQSNNTRTQSVRRTSIRDKTLTSKKEAMEEARLRLRAQEDYESTGEAEPEKVPKASEPVPASTEVEVSHPTYPYAKKDAVEEMSVQMEENQLVPFERKAPEGTDSLADSVSLEHSSPKSDVRSLANDLPTETSYSEGNGNIKIHVSVTINAGTLADLKKQRAQYRNSPETDLVPRSPREVITPEPTILPPPQNRLLFKGENVSDVVGDAKSQSCCAIS